MNILNQKIETNFESFLEDLKTLISIPSVYEEDNSPYPFGKNIDDALKSMLSIAEKIGFTTYYDPEGYYGYADYGTGSETIGILGHLDVVPAGDLKEWHTNPFEVSIVDGKIYGRGVQDDKGPTLAAMYGVKAVIDSGVSINKKIRFIFGTDEERLWECIKKYNEKEQIPDYGFTPDANFPLIYAEKGLLQIDLIADNESSLCFKGGDAYNSVPSNITIEDDHLAEIATELIALNFDFKQEDQKLTVFGKSFHAKDAEKGTNAITRLLMAMKNAGLSSKSIEFITKYINEDALALNIFGPCSDEMSGKLKFNVGKIELNEKEEKLFIDMRIPVSVTKEFVMEKLEKVTSEFGFKIRENDYLRSIYTPLDSKLVKSLMSAYQEVTGDLESQPISSGGATYARAMDNCVAFGMTFPHSKETEHQPNEYATVEDMKNATKIYANAIAKLNQF